MHSNTHPPAAVDSPLERLRHSWERLHLLTSSAAGRWWTLSLGIAIILVLLRALLAPVVTLLINHQLAQPGPIQGSIDSVGLSLIRGVYTVNGLHLTTASKQGGGRVPLLDLGRLRCAVAWSSLVSRHWIGALEIDGLVLHLGPTPPSPVKAAEQVVKQVEGHPTESPSWSMADWRRLITGLVHFAITDVDIKRAEIVYVDQPRGLRSSIGEISGQIKDLIVPADSGRRASFHFGGTTEGHGALAIDGTVLVAAEHPQADIKAELVGVDLPALNHLTEPYEGLVFKSGSFSGYLELAIASEVMRGYFKPIFTHLDIDSYRKKNGSGATKLFWSVVVPVGEFVLKNSDKDQHAARIPIYGRLDDPKSDVWSIVTSALANAFIRALVPGFDGMGDVERFGAKH